jgi:hypothetical protein
MAKLYNDADPDKSDPKVEEVEAEAEVVAKKNGFANLAEHNVVSMNIAMIMSSIDPETKKFTEPLRASATGTPASSGASSSMQAVLDAFSPVSDSSLPEPSGMPDRSFLPAPSLDAFSSSPVRSIRNPPRWPGGQVMKAEITKAAVVPPVELVAPVPLLAPAAWPPVNPVRPQPRVGPVAADELGSSTGQGVS